MSDDEQLVAERVVATGRAGAATVRISQHFSEEFWRVDVTRTEGQSKSATVAPGDDYLMPLIQGAVSGESIAWTHLAHWGRDGARRFA